MKLALIDWGMSTYSPRGIRVGPAVTTGDIYELGEQLLCMTLGSVGLKYFPSLPMRKEYKERVRLATFNSHKAGGAGEKPNSRQGEKKPWEDFVTKYNLTSVNPLIWDLLDKMFVRGPSKMYTARELLEHPYFAEYPKSSLVFNDSIVENIIIEKTNPKDRTNISSDLSTNVKFSDENDSKYKINILMICLSVITSALLVYVAVISLRRCRKGYNVLPKSSECTNKDYDSEEEEEEEEESGEIRIKISPEVKNLLINRTQESEVFSQDFLCEGPESVLPIDA